MSEDKQQSAPQPPSIFWPLASGLLKICVYITPAQYESGFPVFVISADKDKTWKTAVIREQLQIAFFMYYWTFKKKQNKIYEYDFNISEIVAYA